MLGIELAAVDGRSDAVTRAYSHEWQERHFGRTGMPSLPIRGPCCYVYPFSLLYIENIEMDFAPGIRLRVRWAS